ncbi:rod-binding protein [Azospirillum rugosum]|uniref:Rod binding domain-containing protein n=1 Tax=Azospirillum rugosum TaxID=416170 RepID=A0ABS4SHN7_9PROT|nr:rod-binding protein [Azospirillum rugosum]MBP2292091.1 Rod binding domain-containing protein [Azospirillum rugosum]MDQ0525773.1 Rod binding domain-containing protein [Azospirillum rugosum]
MDTALPLPSLPTPRMPTLAERAAQGARAAALDESKADPGKRAQTHAQIRKAADDFENVFVSQMLGHMFDGIEVDETFGGGHGEEMFRSMLTEQYAKQVNSRGGFGIADQVYRELLRAQEVNHG